MMNSLNDVANAIVAPGKGILAADESTNTIAKRFESIGVENTEDNRRAYRELLFTAAGAEDYIGGVILFDETIRQSASEGTPFADLLTSKGIVPGIKVDKGATLLPFSEEETVTEGLDGLRGRLDEYYDLGARFAKWRAVITIGEDIPTWHCIHANAHALARYAALCQEADLVPIVEPEVLMDGDHSIDQCYDVTHAILDETFKELRLANVDLGGIILKPNMVISGADAPEQADALEVAEMTLACFYETVPAAVPGIAFLSGGQTEQESTANLNAINALGPHPWEISFSYGRALQASALRAWGGATENVGNAQAAYLHRAKMNSLAHNGAYDADMEETD